MYGIANCTDTLPPTSQLHFFCVMLYYIACALIKISICVQMTPLTTQRPVLRNILRAIIAITTVVALVLVGLLLAIWKSTSRAWTGGHVTYYDPATLKRNMAIGLIYPIWTSLSDWVVAILPVILLWKSTMKLRYRLGVIALLSSGSM